MKAFTGVRIRVGQVCEQGEVAASHEYSVFATLNRSGPIVDPYKSAPAHLTLLDGHPHGAAPAESSDNIRIDLSNRAA